MWLTWRMSRMLYNRVRDQWNGKEDVLYHLYTDWQYEDWHRDAEDMKLVNFRYNDHRDRSPLLSYWTNMMHKPDADKTKSALKYYKYGNDNYFQWFFRNL